MKYLPFGIWSTHYDLAKTPCKYLCKRSWISARYYYTPHIYLPYTSGKNSRLCWTNSTIDKEFPLSYYRCNSRIPVFWRCIQT